MLLGAPCKMHIEDDLCSENRIAYVSGPGLYQLIFSLRLEFANLVEMKAGLAAMKNQPSPLLLVSCLLTQYFLHQPYPNKSCNKNNYSSCMFSNKSNILAKKTYDSTNNTSNDSRQCFKHLSTKPFFHGSFIFWGRSRTSSSSSKDTCNSKYNC